MWLSQVLHPPNCVGKYFLRRVPYRPITLLYQGTTGQSPQGFPRSALPPLKTCPSRLFLHIRHLLADCRAVVCFFVISLFHYSHRDCLPIESHFPVCAPTRHLASKPSRGIVGGLAHCTTTTPWSRYIFEAPILSLPPKTPQTGLRRLHTAVGAEAALSPYPSAARIGNAALQVIITNQHPTS